MWLLPHPHRVGFTTLSFNNILITLCKLLEVQHDKEQNTLFQYHYLPSIYLYLLKYP